MNAPLNFWYCLLLEKQIPSCGRKITLRRLGVEMVVSSTSNGVSVQHLKADGIAIIPTKIQNGLLWGWWGEPRSKYPETPWFKEWPDSKYLYQQSFYWNAHFTRVSENMLDIHHGPYAHSRIPSGLGKKLTQYQVDFSPPYIRSTGILESRSRKTLGHFFELSNYFPGLFLTRPGNRRIWGLMINTPVSEEESWIVYGHFVKVPILGRGLAYILIKLEMILLQIDDKKMVESCEPKIGSLRNMVLTPADQAIVSWYGLLKRYTKK